MLQRLQVVQGETDVGAVEEKIGCGQVEELIDQVGTEVVHDCMGV